MKKVNCTEAEQRLMVLEILKGTKSVSQVAKERGISDSLIYRWRDKALKAINESFSDKRKHSKQEGAIGERERLLKIIGEQACVIDTLKKTSEMLLR
jgi:transposase